MYSPTRKAASMIRNTPAMMSRTRACAPQRAVAPGLSDQVVDGAAKPVVEQREGEQDAERRRGGADPGGLPIQHRGGPEQPAAEHIEDRRRRPGLRDERRQARARGD